MDEAHSLFYLQALKMSNATVAHVHYLRGEPAPVVAPASIQASGSFDFYVFSQSWQPYFCTTGNYQGCNSPTDFMSSDLTIHGLWPNYKSGSYPSFCGGAALTQSNINQAGANNMAKYWPDVKTGGWTFVANEWKKHGTCSGLSAANYLKAAINVEIQLGTPDIISNNVGSTVATSDLIHAYGSGNVALLCSGSDNALSEVRTCYSKAFQQISCPSTILNEDTCSQSDTVSIYS
ncbi:hypothetical protein AC1031_020473 [Aphanomyces cochlioides]|nr:hypothetical protein AC1031_020473 [Aphanomyces cochlioides]